jgi:hypothetical protein
VRRFDDSSRKTACEYQDASLRPIMPAMMSVRQPMRKASADSPNTSMPAIMLPAAPIPVQSAYAVPNGTDLSEYPVEQNRSHVSAWFDSTTR